MYSSHIRYQFNLLGQKINLRWSGLIFLLMLSIAQDSMAQGIGFFRRNMERYDDKTFHFGFSFALPTTSFNLKHSDTFVPRDTIYSIVSPNNIGFTISTLANMRLNNRWDLRVLPSISLYSKRVEYKFPNREPFVEARESTWFELPVLAKYKSERRKNTRMYLVGGVKFGIETNVKNNSSANYGRLITKSSDLCIEYGIGLEQYFQFFKFAPELRFSHGLINLFEPNKSAYSQGISSLKTHTVTLYLLFE
jgi:Outer membrane protein beta-barrel domain